MDLKGVALVIGAGSGVGRHAALTMAARGVTLIFCADVNDVAAKKTAADIIKSQPEDAPKVVVAKALFVDIIYEESVAHAFETAIKKSPKGRIDYVVHAAGVMKREYTRMDRISLEEYRRMNDVHNIGTFLVLRRALQAMTQQEDLSAVPPDSQEVPPDQEPHQGPTAYPGRRGSIVIVSSLAAKGARTGYSSYVATKHAVEGLVQTAALEYARDGIRVNAVAPTYIDDKALQSLLVNNEHQRKPLENAHPMGRLAYPAEVSEAIIFLLSARSSYVNGVSMPIDGGFVNVVGCQPPAEVRA